MLPKQFMTLNLLGLAAGLALSLASCVGGDADEMSGCIPNMSVACACPNGNMGAQVCLPDGTAFQPCACDGGGDGNDTEGDDDEDTEGAETGEGSSTGGPVCGDGVEDPGECDEMSPDYCPDDCMNTDADSGDSGTTGEVNNCDMMPTFSLMIPNVSSRWEDGGVTGFAAGNQMCMNMGADHVCDYEEIELAFSKNEFAALPAGTTAWLHRTVNVMGMAPGVGGRCVDWTYQTNHISDGEFVTFNGGVPTYTLDNDTNYNPAIDQDNPHVQAGLLECGGVNRAILCCFPECMPEG